MAKKATIVQGQTFTDKEGNDVEVVKYESALKIHVRWSDGVVQTKSAQQLRTNNFSQRTRKTKGPTEKTVQQPYDKIEGTDKKWEKELLGEWKEQSPLPTEVTPSLFQD